MLSGLWYLPSTQNPTKKTEESVTLYSERVKEPKKSINLGGLPGEEGLQRCEVQRCGSRVRVRYPKAFSWLRPLYPGSFRHPFPYGRQGVNLLDPGEKGNRGCVQLG